METKSIAAAKAAHGKYLTFTLGKESYGISVLKVREIIRLIEITMVPQAADYVRGVINLRGKIVPVMDLRVRFNLKQQGTTDRTCIIVVQVANGERGHSLLGLIVDAVEEVIFFADKDIEETPEFSAHADSTHLLGIAKTKEKVVLLLGLEETLNLETISL